MLFPAAVLTAAFSFAAFSFAAFAVLASASATAFFFGKIFTVESFLEFLFCSFAYAFNLAGEMECLACHGMVEVHCNSV